jgi:hypothetical protein
VAGKPPQHETLLLEAEYFSFERFCFIKENELIGKYVIVRAHLAGVFAGILVARHGDSEVELKDARKLWYWSGANSVEQIAVEGVKNPSACKFTQVADQYVLGVIQILLATEEARKIITEVPIWKK